MTTLKESGINKLSDFVRDFMIFKHRNIPNKNRGFEAFKEKYSLEKTEELEDRMGKLF